MTSDINSITELQRLPKIELHLHIDCSLSYDVVSRLDPSITLQEFRHDFVAPSKCCNLMDALTRAHRAVSLLQTRDALSMAIEDVFEQLASDNAIYAELRFAPLLHLERGLAAREVVATVERATEDCIRKTGIEACVILCTLRHFSKEQSLLTAQLLKEFRGSRVVALDIAGDEAGYPLDAHVSAFRFAADEGIHRTAHAGEAAGSRSVWETLEKLNPTRIGHGVRCVEDPMLLERLKTAAIHLEICPTSNIQTDTCSTYASHPVDLLLRQGLSININTDCRTITEVTLNREYAMLQQHFGWLEDQFLHCNRSAIKAAFIEDSQKERLFERLEMCRFRTHRSGSAEA